MAETPWIVGVGHNCLDHLCTVEEYPPENGSTHITSITVQGGGAVATALAASSRLGVPSALVGELGDDAAGDGILRFLEEDGVSTEYIGHCAGGRSSVSYVMVDPRTGSRTKFPYPDALPPIRWDARRREVLRRARVLHLDGTQYENALTAARLARELGIPVSLDGCSVQRNREKDRALASLADILIVNAKYPGRVTGREDDREGLLELASWGPKIVVGTLGEKGCLAVSGGQIVAFPAYPVRAVDTTGAGDVFHGAFLAGYLRGMDLEENIRYASAAAAMKCRKIGGRAGIPDHAAVLRFLAEHE